MLKSFPFYERHLPMGFGTAIAYMQSNGNPFKDHMIGWTLWLMFSDKAKMAQVSWRTAIRLKI